MVHCCRNECDEYISDLRLFDSFVLYKYPYLLTYLQQVYWPSDSRAEMYAGCVSATPDESLRVYAQRDKTVGQTDTRPMFDALRHGSGQRIIKG